MRRDSSLCLKKMLEYRDKVGEDSFELKISFFEGLPNIAFVLNDILDDLIAHNCISRNSQILNNEYDVLIQLTLDGLEYFEKERPAASGINYTVHMSGGQINVVKDNGIVNNFGGNAHNNSKNMKIEDFSIHFCSEDCFVYSTNVPRDALTVKRVDEPEKELALNVRFDAVSSNDYSDKFIGYCIKDVPEDWRWLIENGYLLDIVYEAGNDIDMWIEVKTPLIELYKKEYSLKGKNRISIDLGYYIKKKERWKDISEMCLVFRPYLEKEVSSEIKIVDISFNCSQ